MTSSANDHIPPVSDLPVLTDDISVLRSRPFPLLQNDTLLRAATQQSVTRTPIWCHRQAGRFLPEFRATRSQVDFFTLCKTPHLAAEVTLQPIRRFQLDAAIIFSDILVVCEAMGIEVEMKTGEGPTFPQPLKTVSDFKRVKSAEESNVKQSLSYVYDAITLTRHSLCGRCPLIGFSGAPWTLFAYMVEGSGKKSFDHARAMLYNHPVESREVLQKLTTVICEYLVCQIEAGAQMLELFDSWAGDLTPALFSQFVFPCVQLIAKTVKTAHPSIPFTYFPKGAHFAFPKLNESTMFDVISLDWSIGPSEARGLLPSKSLQGNLDVAVLFGSQSTIEHEVRRMLNGFGCQRLIVNLGHGMLPDHQPLGLKHFVDAVHRISQEMINKQ